MSATALPRMLCKLAEKHERVLAALGSGEKDASHCRALKPTADQTSLADRRGHSTARSPPAQGRARKDLIMGCVMISPTPHHPQHLPTRK